MKKPNIVLIGMMGSGKTTVGSLLAKRMGYPFIDTDTELEVRTGCAVTEIFRCQGEGGFRQLETELVLRVASGNGQVIATGGGVVLNPVNIQALQRNSIIIFLSAPVPVLFQRLKSDTVRPLLQDPDPLQKLKEIIVQRLPLYQQAAAWEVCTAGRTPVEVVEEILVHLSQSR